MIKAMEHGEAMTRVGAGTPAWAHGLALALGYVVMAAGGVALTGVLLWLVADHLQRRARMSRRILRGLWLEHLERTGGEDDA